MATVDLRAASPGEAAGPPPATSALPPAAPASAVTVDAAAAAATTAAADTASTVAAASLGLKHGSRLALPRADVMVIGGDLAYPNPTTETYEQRLFAPFCDALPPPPHYHPGRVVLHKPDLPPGTICCCTFK